MNETNITKNELHVHAIQNLLNGFAEGNIEKVRSALNELTESKQNDLHEKICAMTEHFHQSINMFKSNLDPSHLTMTTTNIPDAAKKLEFVLKATNDATMKLFAQIEKIENNIKKSEEDIGHLSCTDEKVKSFLNAQKERMEDSKNILSEMVITQEYQDLCGQALSKVLKLVREVEDTLKDLIKQFGIEPKTDENHQSPDDTKFDQNEADALLKELGF